MNLPIVNNDGACSPAVRGGWAARGDLEPRCLTHPHLHGTIWREDDGYACYTQPLQPAGQPCARFLALHEAAAFMHAANREPTR